MTLVYIILGLSVIAGLVWYGDKIQKREAAKNQPVQQPAQQPVQASQLPTETELDQLVAWINTEIDSRVQARVAEAVREIEATLLDAVREGLEGRVSLPADFSPAPEIDETPTVEFPASNPIPEALQTIGKWEGTEFALSDRVSIDVATVPHWLIAGATGQGKSSMINVVLQQAIQRDPSELQLALIDVKRVELAPYKHMPHLWRPVATELDDGVALLRQLCAEMDQRYVLLEQAGKKNINNLPGVPRILVVIDELGDLMLQRKKDVEPLLVRIGQLGRAAGIHLIVATQRPSVDIITGILKANLPGRIALRTATSVDSRVILDRSGAEDLNNPGDFILVSGVNTTHGKCVHIPETEGAMV